MSLASDLVAAGWSHGIRLYGAVCVVAIVAAGGVAASIGAQAGFDASIGLLAGALCAAVPGLLLPGALARRQVRRLEGQLGVLLRLLSVRLAFEPFEPALCGACLQTRRPHPALRRLAYDLRHGVPTLAALKRLCSSPSVPVRKAAMQLAFTYRQGDASALDALADEFSHLQSAALQRYAGRTSFSSVWFEAVGAMLPLLLSAYVLVGASFLDFTFPPSLPFWALALVLPLLDGAIVAHLMMDAPEDAA